MSTDIVTGVCYRSPWESLYPLAFVMSFPQSFVVYNRVTKNCVHMAGKFFLMPNFIALLYVIQVIWYGNTIW